MECGAYVLKVAQVIMERGSVEQQCLTEASSICASPTFFTDYKNELCDTIFTSKFGCIVDKKEGQQHSIVH